MVKRLVQVHSEVYEYKLFTSTISFNLDEGTHLQLRELNKQMLSKIFQLYS